MERKNKNEKCEQESRGESNNGEGPAQIDHVIGDFGKYQFLIFMFKILIGVTSAFNNLGVTFFAPSEFVSHWCADVPYSVGYSNFSQVRGEPIQPFYGLKRDTLINKAGYQIGKAARIDHLQILSSLISNEERRLKHNSNLNLETPKNIRKECTYLSPIDNQHHKCTSYKYNTGIWISTIIDEWDLVCDRAWFVSVTQSLYMSGFIIAFIIFGYISDHFGRWRSLLIGALFEVGSGFGCSFASSVTWFMIFRFGQGLGSAGRSASSYLIMIEWCGPKWRMHISTLGSLGWIAGYCAMPWLQVYFLHFRHMQLVVCFYELILVIVFFLTLPESPRWLLTHRRFNEAHEVLLRAARFNGLIKEDSTCCSLKQDNMNVDRIRDVSMHAMAHERITPSAYTIALTEDKYGPAKRTESTTIFDLESASTNEKSHNIESNGKLEPYTLDEFEIKFKNLVKTITAKEFTKNEDNLSILDLFRWKNLRKYFLMISFAWAANSFIYYGIALRAGEFGGATLFISFTLSGLTELPSMAFTILFMKMLPRRTTNLFLFSTVGLLCGFHALFKYYNYQWLQLGAIVLAKLFNSCSFVAILYQTMELFPTSIRQTAYSSCSLTGRFGSILAPFTKELSQYTHEIAPPVIYAILSMLEALLVTRLPETKGSDLKDTLLEAEKFEGTDKKTTRSSKQRI